MTFFSMCSPYFQPIPEDKRIMTQTFLDASRQLVIFFDKMGATFKFVKNDVAGNIEKIDKKFQQDTVKYSTLNAILEEKNTKEDKVLLNAHIGAIWLARGLDFIQEMLRLMVEDHENGTKNENVRDFVMGAYKLTLDKHHNILMRTLFKPLSAAAPYRRDLFKVLRGSDGVTDDMIVADIREYTVPLIENVRTLEATIQELGVKE
ncbi:glycolipid transfer protein A-like [Haliotis rubra]|uniref:glycolipid transfer protein A-like n=1 Tax=Haliotis rubra TaxID=36100 RepID=UPI001EE5BC22|nr:glycolipid transfer protein A-like [Haliotis rubra]